MIMQRLLLWNVVPISLTNLAESGTVGASFNKSIARAAITAFDEYVTTRRRGGPVPVPVSESGVSKDIAKSVDDSPDNVIAASSLHRKRRRRRSVSPRVGTSRRGDDIEVHGAGMEEDAQQHEGLSTTDNDHFFEYQRIRGYHLSTDALAASSEIERLRSEIIPPAAASYLQNECFPRTTHELAQSFVDGTDLLPTFSVDVWAAIQRGDRAHHPDHVHDGAVLSGVYYAAVPEGSAPLRLRRPDDTPDGSDGWQDEITSNRLAQNDSGDVLFWPREGDLILFPPWLYHGVPTVNSSFGSHTAPQRRGNAARVSLAFNITCPFHVGESWDATQFCTD